MSTNLTVAMRESLVRLRNQVEVLLEQAQIKLSSVVSDLFGKSGRRILEALLQGMQDPAELASLAYGLKTRQSVSSTTYVHVSGDVKRQKRHVTNVKSNRVRAHLSF